MIEQFYLAKYRFNLEALERIDLPLHKGSALRGGFGYTFRRIACTEPGPGRCRQGNDCPYCYIFETSPPAGSEVLSKNQDIPMPFALEPAPDGRQSYPPGARFSFDLVLMGQAIAYLPYFIATFRELGRTTGLGRERGKYYLYRVLNLDPHSSTEQAVYQAGEDVVLDQVLMLKGQDLYTYAATLPTHRITLNFLTPTRLKHERRWMEEGPPFQALVKTLLSRTSSLSYFHCGERLEVDFRGWIDRAAQVEIVQSNTRWQDWSRFSGRQEQRVEMGGLVGQVTYEGDLKAYLPLLALGELIHVGKGTVFGNGQYKIMNGV